MTKTSFELNNYSPYWMNKNLSQMSSNEWEALCDGCGLCCLHKLEDIDTRDYYYTNVACRLLDLDTFRCMAYENRTTLNPGCVILSPTRVKHLKWLPKTCAYRLVSEGKDLPKWHPLISGNPVSVHADGISLKGKILRESDVDIERLEDYLIDWFD
jgi:uncharacterized protein